MEIQEILQNLHFSSIYWQILAPCIFSLCDILTGFIQDIINKDVLLAKKLIKKDDFVVIKGRGTLDKKFIIHADNFDEVAVKMIYLMNGTVVLIKH